MVEFVTIKPQGGPQEAFLSSTADICIYGGAAGGGKTWSLLIEPLRHIKVKGFGGVVFRRTYPEVTNEGGLWDEAMRVYPLLGARPRVGDLEYVFPSGCTISFGHLQLDSDRFRWQGSQICYLAFDELTHFSESVFFYMLSRNRSVCGVQPYVRATCNPDPDSWVAKFLEWWIDQDTGYPIPERSGVIRYFTRSSDEVVWADTPEELAKQYPGSRPKSVTFIPASVYDNKILLERDPGYLSNLMALPYIDREQLLGGNWKVRVGAGKIFHRDWFEIVHTVPSAPDGSRIQTLLEGAESISMRGLRRAVDSDDRPVVDIVDCRFWDFAATQPSSKNTDPDFTAGVKIRRIGNLFIITDVVYGKWSPTEVDRYLLQVTRRDFEESRISRIPYRCRWEIEPGSAGMRENSRLIQALVGIDAKGVRPGTGDKWVRAKPFAVQCEAGNVKVLKARWTDAWINHMHSQPEASHDDIMDGSVGAFEELLRAEVKVAVSHQG